LSPRGFIGSADSRTLGRRRKAADRLASRHSPAPELGDRDQRTSGLVAEHLKHLGLDVRTRVGRTGAVGILKGAKPGPVVGLRSNRDHNSGCSTRFPWIVWKRIRRCRFRQGEPQMVGRGVWHRTDVRPTDYEKLGTSQTELPWLLKPFCRQLLLSNK
jgi:hypothetical protein